MPTNDTMDVDLTDRAIYRHGVPHDLFTALRDDCAVRRHRPVVTHAGRGEVEFWSVFRHAEIVQVQRDWETFTATDSVEIPKGQYEHTAAMLTSMDPPQHTRLRRLISSGFTPRMIAKLEEHIADRTHRILDRASEHGECDFVDDVAFLLPMHVIADIVGIPEADRPWVFEQTERVCRRSTRRRRTRPWMRTTLTRELFAYASELSEEKRARPGGRRVDVDQPSRDRVRRR